MVALKCIDGNDEDYDVIIVTDNGVIMKMPMTQISTLKRATQGVRLINLKDNQKVSTVAVVNKESEEEQNEEKSN